MFTVRKVNMFNLSQLYKVMDILYHCGKDMAEKYDLHHWDNSYFKNAIIVLLCILKFDVYLVYNDNNEAVATFQAKKETNSLRLQKVATYPSFSGKGVGSFCLEYAEKMAKKEGCKKICFEVYDKSKHALQFYEHRNYTICGEIKTLKYTELKVEKIL